MGKFWQLLASPLVLLLAGPAHAQEREGNYLYKVTTVWAAPGQLENLLDESGWRLLKRESVSDEYLQSLQTMVEGLAADAATFEDIMEPGEFPETLQRRRQQVSAVEAGVLVRDMYLAEAN